MILRVTTAFALSTLTLGACTGQREVYNNNGLVLVQAGADPTPINGGYNVLIQEQNGVSTVLAVTATGTVAEQIAMPAAIVGGAAALRPDKTEITDNSSVNGGNATGGFATGAAANANAGAAAKAIGGGGGIAPGNSGGQGGNGNKP